MIFLGESANCVTTVEISVLAPQKPGSNCHVTQLHHYNIFHKEFPAIEKLAHLSFIPVLEKQRKVIE